MDKEQREAAAYSEASRECLKSARALLQQVRSEKMVHIKVMQSVRLSLQEAREVQRFAREKLRESQAVLIGLANNSRY